MSTEKRPKGLWYLYGFTTLCSSFSSLRCSTNFQTVIKSKVYIFQNRLSLVSISCDLVTHRTSGSYTLHVGFRALEIVANAVLGLLRSFRGIQVLRMSPSSLGIVGGTIWTDSVTTLPQQAPETWLPWLLPPDSLCNSSFSSAKLLFFSHGLLGLPLI